MVWPAFNAAVSHEQRPLKTSIDINTTLKLAVGRRSAPAHNGKFEPMAPRHWVIDIRLIFNLADCNQIGQSYGNVNEFI